VLLGSARALPDPSNVRLRSLVAQPLLRESRVVIVDDDARFATALSALLESEGLTVVGYGTTASEYTSA
jgi:ActR/RegA family two-component response regulator